MYKTHIVIGLLCIIALIFIKLWTGLDLSYWPMFFISIVIATLATSSGASGSNFWVPMYIFWLNIPDMMAFWLSLITMLFGFGSGFVKHYIQNTIEKKLVIWYVLLTIPGSIIGTLLIPYLNIKIITLMFGVFLLFFGYRVFFGKNNLNWNETVTRVIAVFAGFLKWVIATGPWELLLPRVIRSGVAPQKAVGTTITIVFLTNISSVLLLFFLGDLMFVDIKKLLPILIFVVPGVIIWGQFGPMISEKLSKEVMLRYIAVLLVLIGLIMTYRSFSL